MDDDARARIERLEEEIEALAGEIERSTKLILAARVLAAGGGVAVALALVGAMRLGGLGFLLAVAAALIGLVLWGSSRSTREELRADLARRGAARDALIDALAPRAVGRQAPPEDAR